VICVLRAIPPSGIQLLRVSVMLAADVLAGYSAAAGEIEGPDRAAAESLQIQVQRARPSRRGDNQGETTAIAK